MGGVPERERPLHELVGLRVPECDRLVAALEVNLDSSPFGFEQLAGIGDPLLTATASDELLQAARTIRTNLVEMRLHESGAAEALEVCRLGVARDATRREEQNVARAKAGMHIAGFFRALGSALDCLAAVGIIVLQAPLRVRLADAKSLGRFGKGKKRRGRVPSSQLAAWDTFDRLIDEERGKEPRDWYPWVDASRNAVVHRGRKLHMMFEEARAAPRALVVVTDDPIGARLTAGRFSLHLPKNPEAADMADFVLREEVTNVVLAEPAETTLRGTAESVGGLIEAAVASLLEFWTGDREGWDLPIREWQLDQRPPVINFAGYVGGVRRGTSMAVNPVEGKRVRIAIRVREVLKAGRVVH